MWVLERGGHISKRKACVKWPVRGDKWVVSCAQPALRAGSCHGSTQWHSAILHEWPRLAARPAGLCLEEGASSLPPAEPALCHTLEAQCRPFCYCLFLLLHELFPFQCRGQRKGRLTLTDTYRALISSFYHSVFTHPPRSIWKAQVNVPWQVPAWGWLNDCIWGRMASSEFHRSVTTSLKVRASWHVLDFQASFRLRCWFTKPVELSAKTPVVQFTLVMACAFVFCRVSLTRHCSHQALETESVVSPISFSSSLSLKKMW